MVISKEYTCITANRTPRSAIINGGYAQGNIDTNNDIANRTPAMPWQFPKNIHTISLQAKWIFPIYIQYNCKQNPSNAKWWLFPRNMQHHRKQNSNNARWWVFRWSLNVNFLSMHFQQSSIHQNQVQKKAPTLHYSPRKGPRPTAPISMSCSLSNPSSPSPSPSSSASPSPPPSTS